MLPPLLDCTLQTTQGSDSSHPADGGKVIQVWLRAAWPLSWGWWLTSLSEPPRSSSIPVLPTFQGWSQPPVVPFGSVEERVYMMFDMAVNDNDKLMWCSKVWQQEVYEKEGSFSELIICDALLKSFVRFFINISCKLCFDDFLY